MSDREFWRYLREADKRAEQVIRKRIYYTVTEVAGMLGVKPATVRRHYIKTGRLKATMRYRGGTRDDPRSWRWFISWSDLKAFLEQDLVPGRPRTSRRHSVPGRDWRGRFLAANGGPVG